MIRTCDSYWEMKRDEIRNVELQRITASCTMVMCAEWTLIVYETFFELSEGRETAKEELDYLT